MSVANHEGSKILFPSSFLTFADEMKNENGGSHSNVVGEDIPDIAYQSVTVTSRTNTQPISAIGYRGVPAISDLIGTVEVALEGILCYSPGIYTNATPSGKGLLNKSLYDFVSQWGGIVVQTKGQDNDGSNQTDDGRYCCSYGMFLTSVSYTFQQNTNVTTTWNFVGYNCVWGDMSSETLEPIIGNGVNLIPLTSQHLDVEMKYKNVVVPMDGVQSVTFNATLNRDEVYQIGTKGPFDRPVRFPFEVTATIEVLADYAEMLNNVTPTYTWNDEANPTSPNKIEIYVYRKDSSNARTAKICGAPYQRPSEGSLRVSVGANSTCTINTTGWEFEL